MEVPSAVIIPTIDAEEESPTTSTTTSSIKEKSKDNVKVTVGSASSSVRGHVFSPSDEAYKLPPNAGGEGDDAFANDPSVFDDAEKAKMYWPRKDYEGLHRFFPDFKWTVSEEKKLIRKIDWRITTWVCLMFFALQLDRGNIGQALSDNMLNELKLSTNDYNYGMTIFYLSFLLAEVPSQLVSKKLGPDKWIPIQMVLWSIVACSQSHISGRSSFYATRSLLGLLEGGFIPDCVLYLSYFFKGSELPNRLAWFWTACIGTGVVSSLLGYGILHLRGRNGWAGWQWLFALEGGLTALIGLISWFYLPPSPTQTASRFRGKKGWFTEREEIILVTRILRDDHSKGDMHNRQAITIRKFIRTVLDYDMWPFYIIALTCFMPFAPPTAYLSLILRSLGFSTFQTNLLSIPYVVGNCLQLLFWTWLSERIKGNVRIYVCIVAQLWAIPLLVALVTLPSDPLPWVRYAILTLLLAYPYIHAIQVSLQSRNANSVRTRTIASAFYNMCCQISSIISSNIYRADDTPYYKRGNKVLIAIAVLNIVLYILAKAYYVLRNRSREKKWSAMTVEEQAHYLATTKDIGNKRLDFRFAH